MKQSEYWQPLDSKNWNAHTARHLASRIGFSVRPDIVAEYLKLGPGQAVKKYLLSPKQMLEPESVTSMETYQRDFREQNAQDKRKARQEFRKQNRESYTDFAVAWNEFARNESNAPQEKLTLFFQNVWVVSYQGVKSTPAIFDYQAKIRASLNSNYPSMCKSLALTPAMCRYLNLDKNQKEAPNENFARELFELFVLGEGNYSETDVKEAARALTGYRIQQDQEVIFRPKRHDNGPKTLFGTKGRFNFDDVIRIAFKQKAASTFLPREFCAYYLSDTGIPEDAIEELGALWQKSDFSLPYLYETVFSSKIFYDTQYRGNMIKSPVHFFIGLHQDFDLDLVPLPRAGVRQLRSMGQPFFNPPNVRGWVGGKNWINSATIAARSQLVESVLTPLPTKKLNADEITAIEKAKNAKADQFQIDVSKILKQNGDLEKLTRDLEERLYSSIEPEVIRSLADAIFSEDEKANEAKLRKLLHAALTLPNYHLC